MEGLRRGLMIGTLIGIFLMAGMVVAEEIWYQKMRCEVVIPRTVKVEFGTLSLSFGEVEIGDTSSVSFSISNNNEYDIQLSWSDVMDLGVPEGLETELTAGDTEIEENTGVIDIPSHTSVQIRYTVTNTCLSAPEGTSIKYSWTLRFSMEG